MKRKDDVRSFEPAVAVVSPARERDLSVGLSPHERSCGRRASVRGRWEGKTRIFAEDDCGSRGRTREVRKALTELGEATLVCQDAEIRLC
jgi:hypothetical protein